ncbi:hypothetical protein [Paenibacillus sp. Root444D2]|uniref:hypothetical protein n=1 Tax=Paenibacillus sp. Root444D2 TaxID=1736538 RepID=UPI00070EB6E5|nr:hypothetical protein [Paenibacillus sp. Root444D2]KQX45876.1 hypothetical protein ASD40_18750 [Paenibacillus sp. Root444D2]
MIERVTICRDRNMPVAARVLLGNGTIHYFNLSPDISQRRISALLPMLVDREQYGDDVQRKRRKQK